jgi:hypothetical protein
MRDERTKSVLFEMLTADPNEMFNDDGTIKPIAEWPRGLRYRQSLHLSSTPLAASHWNFAPMRSHLRPATPEALRAVSQLKPQSLGAKISKVSS